MTRHVQCGEDADDNGQSSSMSGNVRMLVSKVNLRENAKQIESECERRLWVRKGANEAPVSGCE